LGQEGILLAFETVQFFEVRRNPPDLQDREGQEYHQYLPIVPAVPGAVLGTNFLEKLNQYRSSQKACFLGLVKLTKKIKIFFCALKPVHITVQVLIMLPRPCCLSCWG
jgi:hypothetical protein